MVKQLSDHGNNNTCTNPHLFPSWIEQLVTLHILHHKSSGCSEFWHP